MNDMRFPDRRTKEAMLFVRDRFLLHWRNEDYSNFSIDKDVVYYKLHCEKIYGFIEEYQSEISELPDRIEKVIIEFLTSLYKSIINNFQKEELEKAYIRGDLRNSFHALEEIAEKDMRKHVRGMRESIKSEYCQDEVRLRWKQIKRFVKISESLSVDQTIYYTDIGFVAVRKKGSNYGSAEFIFEKIEVTPELKNSAEVNALLEKIYKVSAHDGRVYDWKEIFGPLQTEVAEYLLAIIRLIEEQYSDAELLIVDSCNFIEKISTSIRKAFKHKYSLSAPHGSHLDHEPKEENWLKDAKKLKKELMTS